jgi:hypothetical protein
VKKNRNQTLWLGIAAVVILAGIGWVSLRVADESAQDSASVQPVTLSPALFTDQATRDAYQAARDVPEVLEELPCYCGCMQTHGHKNNLFCFMDEHGSACTICQNIALDAKKLHDQGASIGQIQETIRLRYAQYQP